MKLPQGGVIEVGEGAERRDIAILKRDGAAPGFIWLGGFKSDMAGSKAEAVDQWAAAAGHEFVRFDYSGHGRSGGEFLEGTISRWLEESLAVVRHATNGPLILVGSSMGGWLAMLVARALNAAGERDRLGGLVLIAPAIDMTKDLMWDLFNEEAKRQLRETGQYSQPSDYSDEPYILTQALIEDGKRHLFGAGPVQMHCPVQVIQGMLDTDVPWAHSVKLMERLAHDDAVLTLVRDGDHRLSRPEDLDRLTRILGDFAARVGG